MLKEDKNCKRRPFFCSNEGDYVKKKTLYKKTVTLYTIEEQISVFYYEKEKKKMKKRKEKCNYTFVVFLFLVKYFKQRELKKKENTFPFFTPVARALGYYTF